MYTINLFEIHSSHLNNNSRIKLDFDLRIFEDTIQFVNILLTDQHHRLLNVFDIQVSAKSSYTAIKKTVGQVQQTLWVFNQNSGHRVFELNDISALERVRTGDLEFDIEVKAIVEITENGNKMIPLIGSERHSGYDS